MILLTLHKLDARTQSHIFENQCVHGSNKDTKIDFNKRKTQKKSFLSYLSLKIYKITPMQFSKLQIWFWFLVLAHKYLGHSSYNPYLSIFDTFFLSSSTSARLVLFFSLIFVCHASFSNRLILLW